MSPYFILLCKSTALICGITSICIFGVYAVYRILDWAHHGSPNDHKDDLP